MRPKKKPVLKKPSQKSPGHIRVISGRWRGRKLPVIDREGLRPTTDRTKETLFNWLMGDIAGAICLDLFAGSGSLGIEALSRCAGHVSFVEKAPSVVKNLKDIKQMLNLTDTEMAIFQCDAITWLQTVKEAFDVVFLDPPFNQSLLQPALMVLLENNLLNDGALIYVEHEISLSWAVPKQLTELKRKQTQQVVSLLLQFSA